MYHNNNQDCVYCIVGDRRSFQSVRQELPLLLYISFYNIVNRNDLIMLLLMKQFYIEEI